MSISAAASASPTATTTTRRRYPDRYAEDRRARARATLDCELFFEPGRLIVGNAGVLVTTVIYVKRGEAKNFVIVDAAMNDLIRPTLYDAHHEIRPVRTPRAGRAATASPTSSARSARAAIISRWTARCRSPRRAICSR